MSETTSIETVETVENKKAYELRNLTSDDVFPMFKIISKIGIGEFKKCFESDELKGMISGGSIDIEKIGFSIALDIAEIIFSHVADAKKEIYSFLAGLSGMKEKEIAELDMVVFAEMIIDVFKKEQFKDFMKVVSKLFK